MWYNKNMKLPIEVRPPARCYYENDIPFADRLRGTLLRLGAHTIGIIETNTPPTTELPVFEPMIQDPAVTRWSDRGHHTLYVGDPRSIREIVSSPLSFDNEITDDIAPLLAELHRAMITARNAIADNNDGRLNDSLGLIRSLTGTIEQKAETAGLPPAVSTTIDQAHSFLNQYTLAA